MVEENKLLEIEDLIAYRKVLEEEQVVCIRFNSSLKQGNLPGLRGLFLREFQEEHYRIVLDMKLVELLTSAHLGLIWSQKREAVKHGGDIYFAAPGKLVMEAFEAISLTSMMKIFDSVEDALAAFAQESEDSPS
ncbi:STAS domain-containing protein [bacterium]|jgi:anti-anti-sigma factor|nr:STAS domain-containing protein [bacterium]